MTSRITLAWPVGTVKVGVVSLVVLSVGLLPVSLAACRSGAAGAEGAWVSMTMGSAGLAAPALPAAST